MSRYEEFESMLQALPNLTPDPRWRERTKLKLMHMLGPESTMADPRRWAPF